ncbi:universal stress protein [Granulosicoccus sp.]|nr:universal stress protein [Granulosicoccus sp.]MDB4224261.1 universal stress protein [Granulosicoccus sp.]
MFSKLLVPIDMSSPEAGLRSCPRARELQDAFGAKVHLMSVLPGYNMPMVASFFPKSAVDTMRAEVMEEMVVLATRFFETPPIISVRTGKRAEEILELADEWGPDLIVFGCRPKDVLGGALMLGSCGASRLRASQV